MPMHKSDHRLSRKKRIRAKLAGTSERPRLTVFRSLKQITVQVIDDAAHRTIAGASTKSLKGKSNVAGAKALGTLIAKKAKEQGVNTVVFDRNGYKYHGCIKAVADAAREGGLQF